MSHTILTADDNVDLTDSIRDYLKRYRYDVVAVCNGEDTVNYMTCHGSVGAILLEVMIQGMDGWETCRRLREITNVPILILTSLRHASDIVRGFDLGADDYLLKPFHFDELRARLEACMRRARVPGGKGPWPVYLDDNLYIDLSNHDIRLQDRPISLSPTEFRLLDCLVRHEGFVVNHETLLTEVWGSRNIPDLNALKLYVSYLRRKIEPNPGQPRYILTEWNMGYRFCKRDAPMRIAYPEPQMERPRSAIHAWTTSAVSDPTSGGIQRRTHAQA
jgi:two-component system KDP operon response regulator KdpE